MTHRRAKRPRRAAILGALAGLAVALPGCVAYTESGGHHHDHYVGARSLGHGEVVIYTHGHGHHWHNDRWNDFEDD